MIAEERANAGLHAHVAHKVQALVPARNASVLDVGCGSGALLQRLAALGYGIRAMVRVGRTDYGAMSQLIARLPEVVNAWNITGEDSWALEIAVVDVAHLDDVVSQLCLMGETSTSIILKTLREHRAMLPRVKENTE